MLLAQATVDAGMSNPDVKLSPDLHREIAAAQISVVQIAIVTVSDSRTPETDTNMHYLRPQIEGLGHSVAGYELIKDEPDQVAAVLNRFVASEARLILFNGGTGIAPRDTTYDVLARMIEKPMPGFANSSACLVTSRSERRRCSRGPPPGSIAANWSSPHPARTRLCVSAWEKLIAPELQHLAWEVVR